VGVCNLNDFPDAICEVEICRHLIFPKFFTIYHVHGSQSSLGNSESPGAFLNSDSTLGPSDNVSAAHARIGR